MKDLAFNNKKNGTWETKINLKWNVNLYNFIQIRMTVMESSA